MRLLSILGIRGARDKPKDSYGGVFLCADSGGDGGVPAYPFVPLYGDGEGAGV